LAHKIEPINASQCSQIISLLPDIREGTKGEFRQYKQMKKGFFIWLD